MLTKKISVGGVDQRKIGHRAQVQVHKDDVIHGEALHFK